MKKKPLSIAQRQARIYAKQQAAALRDGFRDGKHSARSQALKKWTEGTHRLIDLETLKRLGWKE